jgi:two-component system sensor histidine kinase and response regulator WspE
MSAPADDELSLLELFRAEVEAHAAVLSDGLVALDAAGADAATIEPLMRAAHSIKGAARVVGLDAAVRIAHAMEDALVAAQDGRRALSAAGVDVLLRGVDWIAALSRQREDALPTWLLAQADAAERLERDLAALETASPTNAASNDVAASAAVADGIADAPARVAPDEADLRAVKVTAEALSRLIGLASESLVQARQIEPLVAAFQQVKLRHTALADGLRRVREDLARGAPADRLGRVVSEAERTLHDARQLLSMRMSELEALAQRTAGVSARLYHQVVSSRMRPFGDTTAGLPRLVRDVARRLGKQAQLEISGRGTEVDREVLADLEAPLTHLLRNAVDHGIETPAARTAAGKSREGRIALHAGHVGGMLVVRVRDDGAGIDPDAVRARIRDRGLAGPEVIARLSESELYDFLLLPGFSTRETVSEISGRGVGLDAVQAMVHAAGGTLRISSTPGAGTEFELRLPVTRSVLRAVVVTVAGEAYAFPLARIERVVALEPAALRTIEGRAVIDVGGAPIALVAARDVLGLEGSAAAPQTICAVVIGEDSARFALEVEAFVGEADLVVRPLDPRLGTVPDVRAAATLADGSPVLVLEVDDLVRSIDALVSGGRLRGAVRAAAARPTGAQKRVLVVDDSLTVRELERRILEAAGYAVDLAVDGMEGWHALRLGAYDLVLTDVDMPRLNGIELVRRIRADARLRDLPVIVVSYKDREADRLRGLEAGADRYLTKSSFHDETLAAAVRELVGEAAE